MKICFQMNELVFRETLTLTVYTQESIPIGCVPPTFVVRGGGGYGLRGVSGYIPASKSQGLLWESTTSPPSCVQDDRRLWKHYLPATSFVGGKNVLQKLVSLHYNSSNLFER